MKNMQRIMGIVVLALLILLFAHNPAVLADASGQPQGNDLSDVAYQAAETPVITVVVTTHVTTQPAPSSAISTPALIIIIVVVLIILVGIFVSSRTRVHHVD